MWNTTQSGDKTVVECVQCSKSCALWSYSWTFSRSWGRGCGRQTVRESFVLEVDRIVSKSYPCQINFNYLIPNYLSTLCFNQVFVFLRSFYLTWTMNTGLDQKKRIIKHKTFRVNDKMALLLTRVRGKSDEILSVMTLIKKALSIFIPHKCYIVHIFLQFFHFCDIWKW